MKLINVGDQLVARKDLLGHVIDVPVGHANPTIPKNGVSFNSKFIAEAMKVLGKNDATIQHTGDALSPVIIHGSDGSKHVIMPMRTE
jgi:DNA polymerase III sliding clamp (beta) subunit (PCNA family)